MASMRSCISALAILVSVLCSCSQSQALSVDDGVPARIVELNDKNFEHHTQAATGQTTGVWLVLFGAPDCSACAVIEKAFQELAEDLEDNTILAKVDITQNPVLAYRFDIQSTPHLKLFRNRRMYSYTGGHTADHFRDFLEGGFRELTPENVPLEKGVVQQLREKLTSVWKEYNELNPLARLSGALVLLLIAISLLRFQQAGSDRAKRLSVRAKQLHRSRQEKKSR